MRRINLHAETSTQLALIRRELDAELRGLRERLHSLGPSVAREGAIAERQSQIESIERELAHRRLHDSDDT